MIVLDTGTFPSTSDNGTHDFYTRIVMLIPEDEREILDAFRPSPEQQTRPDGTVR